MKPATTTTLRLRLGRRAHYIAKPPDRASLAGAVPRLAGRGQGGLLLDRARAARRHQPAPSA
jgi:hypothetical protein